jgi:two-component system, chemotaxis family, chemotaxis protein CheY
MVSLSSDPEYVAFTDLTIMIVDDNQYMRQLIGHMLRAFEVGLILHSTNARDAFEEIRQTRIDCLIVDWLMPGGMSGIEFVNLVRTSPKSPKPDIPLILCTGHTEKERVMEARDAGVSEVLTKPVSPRSLMHKLRLAIYRPRPFIISPAYTGPDRRRRKNIKYAGIERRRTLGLHQDDIDALLNG